MTPNQETPTTPAARRAALATAACSADVVELPCGMPEDLWRPGDIVTRDGSDEHRIISINEQRDLLEVECVKEPAPYTDGGEPWTRIGQREWNLPRRYSFVLAGKPTPSTSTTMSANDSASSPNSAAHSGWMMRLVGHLFRCRHDWSITAINGFGSPSEEICIKCGEYRHRIHDHRIIGREEWKTGRHPKSK